jgi:hypothetical protein
LGCGDEKKTKMYQVALWKTKDKNPLISLWDNWDKNPDERSKARIHNNYNNSNGIQENTTLLTRGLLLSYIHFQKTKEGYVKL